MRRELFLLTLLIASAQTSHHHDDQSSRRILDFTFSRQRQTRAFSEFIAGSDGVVAMQQTSRTKDRFLQLAELTNGTFLVQLIFTSNELLSDCDVSTSRHHIRKMLKHTYAKYKQDGFTLADERRNKNLTNLDYWITRCNNLHANVLRLGENQPDREIVEVKETVRINREGIITQLNTENTALKSRQKRGIFSLIYPGTKWCGKGNSSQYYVDFGENRFTDKCCRNHDYCQEVIPAMTEKYNYFNYGLLTLSSCSCDKKFRNCLKRAAKYHSDPLADWIGYLYFNYIGMECFTLKEKDVCTKRSFWLRCLKTERRVGAVFNGHFVTY